MISYGYVKDYMYTGTGELQLQVRIPNIHGPVDQREYLGQRVRNYVDDSNLPWYPSLLLPHTPNTNEVVALLAVNEAHNEFVVIGLTGGQYMPSQINSD